VVVHFRFPDLRYGADGGVDPLWLRLCIAAVLFGVLAVLGRDLLRRIGPPQDPLARADASSFKPKSTPRETAAEMARVYSDVTDDASRVRAISEWLAGILTSTVLVPFIFYLRFGEVGPLGWGLTVFFDLYCLLWAFGLYFLPRTEYHTQVKARGDWIDKVGAFWLVGCAFGPLFGWTVTSVAPLTPESWRWVYGMRAFLAAALPVLLALPTLRYARGKSATIVLPLAIVLTSLPVSTAIPVILDLRDGPAERTATPSNPAGLYLPHTERSLTADSG
jgi:hypothetical protein